MSALLSAISRLSQTNRARRQAFATRWRRDRAATAGAALGSSTSISLRGSAIQRGRLHVGGEICRCGRDIGRAVATASWPTLRRRRDPSLAALRR